MIVSILLILVIVLQEAKTAGMGAAVGGSSDSFFGGKARGKDAVLSKFTVILGIFIRGHLYWTWTIFKYILIKGPCVKRGLFLFYGNQIGDIYGTRIKRTQVAYPPETKGRRDYKSYGVRFGFLLTDALS